jgi:hypothetical protein
MFGKAKVMSYEDLEEARAKRVIKESTQAANAVRRARVVRLSWKKTMQRQRDVG